MANALEQLAEVSNESIIDQGQLDALCNNVIDDAGTDVPAGSVGNSAVSDEAQANEKAEVRVASDGSYYLEGQQNKRKLDADPVANLPQPLRGLAEDAIAQCQRVIAMVDGDRKQEIRTLERELAVAITPPPKKRKNIQPPAAPIKPAPVSRGQPSPVVTQILAGLEQYPEEDIPELGDLVRSLRGQYASFSLQRLLADLCGRVPTPANCDRDYRNEANWWLRQILLVCFGYASASEESRVILRETIKLPNFISKDKTVVLKHCKNLLGNNFPTDQQPIVIGVLRGLWHLFSSVHILPTVFLNNRWVYETVDDCVNKAVRFSFNLPADCWWLIDQCLFNFPADRARLRRICRYAAIGGFVVPRPPTGALQLWNRTTYYTTTYWIGGKCYPSPEPLTLSHTAVCAHCLHRDHIREMRGDFRTSNMRLFWRCWKCALMTDYQDRLTASQWKEGTLIVRLERSEVEAELREDGSAHSIQSYEDAVCSQKPIPRGYKVELGFSNDELIDT